MSAADPGPEELAPLLRRPRMPHVRRVAPEVLATARAQAGDPAEVLEALLEEEVAGGDRSGAASRLKAAGFPSGKTFEAWDEGASSIPLPTRADDRGHKWIWGVESPPVDAASS